MPARAVVARAMADGVGLGGFYDDTLDKLNRKGFKATTTVAPYCDCCGPTGFTLDVTRPSGKVTTLRFDYGVLLS